MTRVGCDIDSFDYQKVFYCNDEPKMVLVKFIHLLIPIYKKLKYTFHLYSTNTHIKQQFSKK